jgi:hypothetical protein
VNRLSRVSRPVTGIALSFLPFATVYKTIPAPQNLNCHGHNKCSVSPHTRFVLDESRLKFAFRRNHGSHVLGRFKHQELFRRNFVFCWTQQGTVLCWILGSHGSDYETGVFLGLAPCDPDNAKHIQCSVTAYWSLVYLTLRPWRLRRYIPPKHLSVSGLHVVRTQKIVIFIVKLWFDVFRYSGFEIYG